MLKVAEGSAPQLIELPHLTERKDSESPLLAGPLSLLRGVKVRVAVSLGVASMTVGELTALKDGAVVKLDRGIDQPVDLVLEGQVVARGRIVAIDDNFGISITEVAGAAKA